MQTADIRYRFLGDASDLETASREAQTALDRMGDAARRAGERIDRGMGEAADKAGRAAVKLRGALGSLGPAFGGVAGMVDDAADALEALSLSGASFSTGILPLTAGLGTLAAAYVAVTTEITREAEATAQAHTIAVSLRDVTRELAGAQVELALATGQLTEAQGAQARNALAAQAAVIDFAEGQRESRKAIQDSLDTAETWRAWLTSIPTAYEPAVNALVDYVGNVDGNREALDRLNAAEADHAAKTKAIRETLDQVTVATEKATAANDARNTSIAKTVSLQDQLQAELDRVVRVNDNIERSDQARAQKREEDLQAELDRIDRVRAYEEQHAAYRAEQEQAMIDLRKSGTDQAIEGVAALGEAMKDAGKAGFAISKGIALAQVAIDTARGVAKAVAEFAAIPPLAAAVSATIVASGAIQAAKIAAEQPKFHLGGVVQGRPGAEVPITAQAGEGMLTAQGVAGVGGPAGVDAINRHGAAAGGGVTLFQYEHRVGGRFIRDEVRGSRVVSDLVTTRAGRRTRST